jgi:hypothetical protein
MKVFANVRNQMGNKNGSRSTAAAAPQAGLRKRLNEADQQQVEGL